MKLLLRLLPALPLLLLAPDVQSQTNKGGAVFTMTNAGTGNEIVIFSRGQDGLLTPAGSVATDGLGTGAGLGSQTALGLSRNRETLVAVNAGSDEISVFKVDGTILQLTDVVPSGGDMPVSVALRKDVLYVLHAGSPNSVTGFMLSDDGKLTPIPASTRPLSAPSTEPAQVGWHPKGNLLIVTEKATNLVDTFAVDTNSSLLGTFVMEPSVGDTPFGFAFRGSRQMLVSEAAGEAPDAGSLSSYKFNQGALEVVQSSLATTETSTCWVVSTPSKKYAYVSNTGSDSITGFGQSSAGPPVLLNPDGVTATTGDAPTDLALSRNGQYLYVLNSADGTISGYGIDPANGSLTSLQQPVGGLPAAGASGLAAH
jgi:6-phosphogluconolactonase